ncbi:MAG: 16S rRNA (cytidine(1402)-2'-O)-methyltransferase [Candidatus Binatia bacterium]
MTAPGRLYVVATPIGNMGDLSPRAVETLASVDLVAAEDTRVSAKLVERAGSRAKLLSYRDHNENRLAPRLVRRMLSGQSVALVSDAGTPCISDPGYRLVQQAAEAGIEVVSVSGPSALTALLSISGLPVNQFSFEGFLPAAAAARRKALIALAPCDRTVVFFESPRRVVALLEDLAELHRDPRVAVGRELTKRHEQVLRGRASELAALLAEGAVRGEFVVAAFLEASEVGPSAADLRAEVSRLLEAGLSVRDAAVALKSSGVARRQVYAIARELR